MKWKFRLGGLSLAVVNGETGWCHIHPGLQEDSGMEMNFSLQNDRQSLGDMVPNNSQWLFMAA